jgi:predicted GH43/DUF377 family glycosyl hydrolase
VFGHGHGLGFHLRDENPSIMLPLGRKQHLAHIQDVRISQVLDQRVMTYTDAVEGAKPQLYLALESSDEGMTVWDVPSVNRHLTGAGMLVPEYMHDGQYVLYYGDGDINVAFSKNLVAWHAGNALAAPRREHFDRRHLTLIAAAPIEQGLLVLYQSREAKRGQVTVSVGALLCSAANPEQVIWRSDEPLYQETARDNDEPTVLGADIEDREITVYFTSAKQKLRLATFANPYATQTKVDPGTRLHRFSRNPVLTPTAYEWESQAVFNPAAIVDNGRVHLLYRAMGPDGVSRIGYASSADGVHFDDRHELPAYTPTTGHGAPTTGRNEVQHYDPRLHPSGGGWAGCEDPRAVSIDGRLYMTFTAFDGWDFMRIALTSISLDHLNQKNWRWQKPVLISRPHEPAKNWVLFPEKVNGKYAILHGVSPKIHIEYIDDLEDLNGRKFINSLPSHGGGGYHDSKRQDHWDNRMRGAGAPPIKTDMGWLLLYHATDKRDPGKYKLGAMLLDLDDPTKVLYRTNAPILEPQEWYENHGKPGVVYTCGAVVLGENLIVYYGGGDKQIAVARANLEHFLKALATNQAVPLNVVA